MLKVNYIFRNPDNGGFSIEELFSNISSSIRSYRKVSTIELPYKGAALGSILKNLRYISGYKRNQIFHITGDVHYVALVPFRKFVLTIHDCHMFNNYSNLLKKVLIKYVWFYLPVTTASVVTVISEHTKKDLIRLVPWARRKIVVVPNPVNSLLERQPKNWSTDRVRILHLGTKKNKNLENTIRALAPLRCTLVIVGRLSEEHRVLLEKSGINYENYSNIPYSKIKDLYETSDVVNFVSLYEGFGMPIIEAQQVGRVVVTSPISPMKEVAGSGAAFAEPNDIEDIRKTYVRLIQDSKWRNSLIENGFINVQKYQLEAVGKEYEKIYAKLDVA